jgi:hypothetical protein
MRGTSKLILVPRVAAARDFKAWFPECVTCPDGQFAPPFQVCAPWRAGCFFRAGQVLGWITIAAKTFDSTGDRMPRYLSQHTLACLTRQGAEELSRRLLGGQAVTARRVIFNMQEGKMLAEFDAPGREELEKWLKAGKFHFDWLLRIELEAAADGSLQPVS